MAVIEYSLRHGISTVFHTYMSPEDHRIPMGYSFEIQQNATESHGLPLDCEPMRMREASSWSWIVAQFLDVVNPKRFDEAFPPLFTIGVKNSFIISKNSRFIHYSFSRMVKFLTQFQ